MRLASLPTRLAIHLAVLLAALRFFPHAPILDGQPWSRSIQASGGELMRLTLAADQQYRSWTPLDRISPQLVEAVLLYEDRAFYWHPGFNPYALARSALASATNARKQGGSTLTMQLARRLYDIDSRSVAGKLTQIGAAVWLELRYSKAEILEAYLNLAPYGGNIEGVGAASLIYLRKPAAHLTLPEAVALAVVPQNPRQRLLGVGTARALADARVRLWQRWVEKHPGDARLAADQRLVLQSLSRSSLPFLAPHATDLLLRTSAPTTSEPPLAIRASIDLRLQRTLERVLAEYLQARAGDGITNASAMLVDSQDMRVKAMIGSADFFNDALAGQVNGTRAKRSPGSTLKPFIYGLALDQGVIHPMSLLKDAPTAFGAFSPENFDGRFAGPVSAQDALIRSRNIPAVSVAARLSKPDLYDFLKMAGVDRLESKEHYGLALVLGGGEVTLEELAQLYAMLANGGVWRPLEYQVQAGAPRPNTGTRLLSEEAAFIVLDMLRQVPRPDTELPARPAIAWKTGTSWGFRDAWTAGVFGRYVLVVWVGNFDGAGNPTLVGIEAAAPLFLRMVDAIRAERLDPGEMVSRQPPDLRRVEVCTASGDLVDDLCTARTATWFIAGKSPIRRSSLHRTVWVDSRTGLAYCSPGEHREARVYEYWPSDLRRLFRQAGLPRREPPALPDCAKEGGAPQIASPLRGVNYALRINKPEPVLLRAEADSGAHTLFWFVDDAMVGRSSPGDSLAWLPPSPRAYRIRVVDDAGRSDSRDLSVEFVP
jgi:penicillin-binding protein 1C